MPSKTAPRRGASDGTLKRLIKRHLAAKDAAKKKYAEADELADRVIALLKPGRVISLDGGREAEIVDNFAIRNKTFRQCGVSRFEIKVRDV